MTPFQLPCCDLMRRVERKKRVLRTQVELKQTAERLHVQDISTSMSQTEAFRLMMREKESLIAEKYQLTDKLSTLRKQSKATEEKWQREKEALEETVSEKSSALEDMETARDQLQTEIARLKVIKSMCIIQLRFRNYTFTLDEKYPEKLSPKSK